MAITPIVIPNMTNAQFKAWMVEHKACKPAQVWVGGRSLKSAWGETRNFSWMAWFVLHYGVNIKVLIAAQTAAFAAADAYRKSKSNPTQNNYWTIQRATFRKYFVVQ